MTQNVTDFARLVSGFLTDYLPLQRNYSKNTILSYRDSLKLLIKFITDVKGIKLNQFSMNTFDRELIRDYLEWLRQCGSKVSTTNQRLAAIKSFAEYAGIESIENLASLQSVQAIKSKKQHQQEIIFMSVDETRKLINYPDVNTINGLRHRVILTLLYDSGCRVQELCDLRICDFTPSSNPTVRLHGKGMKYRTVIISVETGKLVSAYIDRHRKRSLKDQPLVTNRTGNKLTRDGVNHIIQKYCEEIRKEDPNFPKDIHAHSFRHSKAMHMLAAGINIIYIRDFLGHENISTTMIYAKADNRLKAEAINKLAPKVTEEEDLPDWLNDKELMSFLNSLK